MTNGGRRKPRRRGATVTVVNPKYTDSLIAPVGKFMINFGTLELLSHLWIDLLAKDETLVDLAIEQQFGRRVTLLLQLVEREEEATPEFKKNVKDAWMAAKDLAEVRNGVAHNPAIFGWHGPEDGEPDYVGIPIVRKLARNPSGKIPYYGADGLNKAVDAVVEVATQIKDLFEQMRAVVHLAEPESE